ncbi:uncharacterized protein G2W53_020413 [Senna tora]|uniref:Uncharacterized protein n=1 Tax=Senna tora TaxID=362788 RepID=A0A834WSD0_9FABA|nr:uncharacterized protein G2W53_020413 [Senna tora]
MAMYGWKKEEAIEEQDSELTMCI